jgi:predicted MPP superfamily phosphohydrolase
MAGISRSLGKLFPSPMKHPDIIRQGWIKGNVLHNFLVLLYHVARIPLLLCGLALAGLVSGVALVYEASLAAGIVLGGAVLADLLLLAALPRLGISFGWVQPPWLLFGGGRALLALLPVLAPDPLEIWTLLALQLALTGLALYASMAEPFRIQHTRLRLELPGLGAPLRVLLLTDLHIERLTRREERAARAIEVEQPDLILLGGDLLNLSYVGEPQAMAHARRFLARLAAPAGVYFVRGTRDVDVPEVVRRILEDAPNIRAVENERLAVRHGGSHLELVGIPADQPFEQLVQRLESLVQRAPEGAAVVCLHHTPDLVQTAADLGVDLYLAGHTHGGQICIPLLGPIFTASRLGRRFVRGLHRVGPRTIAYISRGLGLEGLGAPRMRFLSRPELVWLELRPAALRDTPGSRSGNYQN